MVTRQDFVERTKFRSTLLPKTTTLLSKCCSDIVPGVERAVALVLTATNRKFLG